MAFLLFVRKYCNLMLGVRDDYAEQGNISLFL